MWAETIPFRTTPETVGNFDAPPIKPRAKIRQFKDTPREAAAALPTLLPFFANGGSSYLSFANKARKDCLSAHGTRRGKSTSMTLLSG
jgi:hypothetical protein